MTGLAVAVAVAVAAVAAASALLLTFGGDRHDPVGQLSPVAHIAPPPAAPPQVVDRGEKDD